MAMAKEKDKYLDFILIIAISLLAIDLAFLFVKIIM